MDIDYGQRLMVFLEKKIPIHIKTHKATWINGFILEIGAEFVIIDEFKLGRVLVFFSEIFSLETYTKERKE